MKKPRFELWDAINHYTEKCGGDTGARTATVPRMVAVTRIENEVDRLIAQASGIPPPPPERPAIVDGFDAEKMNELVGLVESLAEAVARKGPHFDTCSFALNEEYDCDCGYEYLRKILEVVDL